jgi:endoglucanase
VRSIDAGGRIGFVPLGSWWGHVLLGQRVDVLGERGRVTGVIGSIPPHFLAPEEREKVLGLDKMYVDVGATERGQVERLGVRVGDPVVPRAEFVELAVEGMLSGKAFDDRVGVALMCETMLALRDREHPNTVVGVGAVQEELGCRGAGTASELARPDVALVLECAPADDLPNRTERQAVLGEGPQVRLYDPTAVANRRLVRLIESVAREGGIPIQLAVRRTGGTDASAIQRHRAGVPAAVIAVPGRYIHSHVSIVHRRDYLAARRLLAEVVLRLDAERVEALTRFD